jgi:ribosomal protein S18 acetylase RimI-like enzyme
MGRCDQADPLSGGNQNRGIGQVPGQSEEPRQEPGNVHLVRHRCRGWRLRYAPGQLHQLQQLLDSHSFWAQGRTPAQLRQMLAGSQAMVSAWRGERLVGFGRATSDGVFRAVLWDVVVAADHQGQGLGRRLMEALLEAPELARAERVYLMTTNSAGFYEQLGFTTAKHQQLMLRQLILREQGRQTSSRNDL